MVAKALLVVEEETECATAGRPAVQEATSAVAMEVVPREVVPRVVRHLHFQRVFSQRPLKLHLINATEDPYRVY